MGVIKADCCINVRNRKVYVKLDTSSIEFAKIFCEIASRYGRTTNIWVNSTGRGYFYRVVLILPMSKPIAQLVLKVKYNLHDIIDSISSNVDYLSAFTAGVIDGDGSITGRGRNRKIVIVNTDLDFLSTLLREWLKFNVKWYGPYSKVGSLGKRPIYYIEARYGNLNSLCKYLIKYVKLKHQELIRVCEEVEG